ncbi:MAG: asparagine synthase (glutamine-hydrolyzing) [Oceanospirillaceae bacterium]|nr:asparagine synthase (glutamine-hydrolyzing) [Oceanospirillaceae bacterium]
MCGIAGSYGGDPLSDIKLNKCRTLLKRRGPDGFGYFDSKDGCQLLHSRLAIIDIDDRSKQPFFYHNLVIVFNGEIYNYLELRAELQKEGVSFHTDSDTEVLAACWKKWGSGALNKFDGMWSLAVYDSDTKNLIVATDPFGEKPLFYTRYGQGVSFASRFDVLALVGNFSLKPDLVQLSNYLSNGYKSLFKSDRTFVDGVKRLPQGHLMEVSARGVQISKYWQPNVNVEKYSDQQEAIQHVRKGLIDSVRLRLRSDVPLAFCLSGGIDSSALIGAAVKELGVDATGFTIANSDGRYDEAEQVKITQKFLGINSIIVRPSEKNFITSLADMVEDRTAPVATISYYTQNLLYEEMAKHGFKVGMSGTGADELFTGYYDHHLLYLAENFDTSDEKAKAIANWQKHINPIIRNPLLKQSNRYLTDPSFREHVYYRSDFYASFLNDDLHEAFCEQKYSDSLLRSRMMNELFHEAVPVILNEDDSNAMYHSIENRSPYLSRPLLDIALRLPENKLIQNGLGKYYLRKAAEGFVHPDILWNRKKIGFNSSLFEFFNPGDKDTREFILDDSAVFDVVDRTKIEQYVGSDLSLNSDSKFLFNFINAKLFMEMFT